MVSLSSTRSLPRKAGINPSKAFVIRNINYTFHNINSCFVGQRWEILRGDPFSNRLFSTITTIAGRQLSSIQTQSSLSDNPANRGSDLPYLRNIIGRKRQGRGCQWNRRRPGRKRLYCRKYVLGGFPFNAWHFQRERNRGRASTEVFQS